MVIDNGRLLLIDEAGVTDLDRSLISHDDSGPSRDVDHATAFELVFASYVVEEPTDDGAKEATVFDEKRSVVKRLESVEAVGYVAIFHDHFCF